MILAKRQTNIELARTMGRLIVLLSCGCVAAIDDYIDTLGKL